MISFSITENSHLKQLLCEIEDVCSQPKCNFGVVDIIFYITFRQDAVQQNQRFTFPLYYREKQQDFFDARATTGINGHMDIDAAKKKRNGLWVL